MRLVCWTFLKCPSFWLLVIYLTGAPRLVRGENYASRRGAWRSSVFCSCCFVGGQRLHHPPRPLRTRPHIQRKLGWKRQPPQNSTLPIRNLHSSLHPQKLEGLGFNRGVLVHLQSRPVFLFNLEPSCFSSWRLELAALLQYPRTLDHPRPIHFQHLKPDSCRILVMAHKRMEATTPASNLNQTLKQHITQIKGWDKRSSGWRVRL